MRWKFVTQGTDIPASFEAAFKKATTSTDLDRLDVAVAYATNTGLPILDQAHERNIIISRWVLGLNDAVTQPKTIEQLISRDGTQVRVAAKGSGNRFHPKIYQLWSSTRPELCVSYIGSGNLTKNGLESNAEAGVILTSETKNEAKELRDQWQSFWDIGHELSQETLDEYRAIYKASKAARVKINPGAAIKNIVSVAKQTTLKFDGTPETASVGWTECATPSAGGRDLEFPKKIMPFFNLQGSPSEKSFRMTSKAIFKLKFTMRTDNQMWRLLFSSESIRAAIGRNSLRPNSGKTRSDLAVKFTHSDTTADYEVEIIVIGSSEHEKLIEKSKQVGTLNHTGGKNGRHFGYY